MQRVNDIFEEATVSSADIGSIQEALELVVSEVVKPKMHKIPTKYDTKIEETQWALIGMHCMDPVRPLLIRELNTLRNAQRKRRKKLMRKKQLTKSVHP